MTDIIKYISDKLSLDVSHWMIKPFPHIIIDNFLPEDTFNKISYSIITNEKNFKDVKSVFNTTLEFGKKTYNDTDLNQYLKMPIEILGSNHLKNFIEKIIGNINLISLTEIKNYGGYSPFHVMEDKGFLGSHVDHSRSIANDFHVANSIFYASPNWDVNYGGETILFSKNGLKIKKLIEPKPNRLIIFLHTAETFHGVNKITSDPKIKRYTYYMDYYIKNESLKNIKFNLSQKDFFPIYCDHNTTFIPLFPLGLKSFKFKSFLKIKVFCQYITAYIKYLFNKNFKRIEFN